MGKILIVDGDRQLRGALAANLRSEGFEVAEASTGWACLQMAETEGFSQVFLNERLPDQDGWGVLARLAKNHAELPVLFILEAASDENHARAIAAGACDALAKPLRLHKLTSAVRACQAKQVARAVERLRAAGLAATN